MATGTSVNPASDTSMSQMPTTSAARGRAIAPGLNDRKATPSPMTGDANGSALTIPDQRHYRCSVGESDGFGRRRMRRMSALTGV